MTDLFIELLNRSIAAGWLVLAVLAARLLLRRAPRWSRVLLWGLVAVRLVCPVTLESIFSLLPTGQTVSPDIGMQRTPAITSGVTAINNAVNPVLQHSFAPQPAASANPLQIWLALAAVIWAVGAAGMLLYALVSWLRLRRRLATAVRLRDNIFQSERIDTPFVLGMLWPRIYLPFRLSEEHLDSVIAHEQAHIRRGDHWWKPLGFVLLAVYWFHPLLWLAYWLFCRDIEGACDEKVIRNMDPARRADYSQALLACSVGRHPRGLTPLAFGETGVKQRIQGVLHYKKPAFWLVVLAALVCAGVAVAFLTDPVEPVRNPWVQEYEPGAEGMVGQVDKAALEQVSPDFAIGADAWGRAVFKEPYKAFDTFVKLYAEPLERIQKAFDLPAITRREYKDYLLYGWQLETEDEEQRQQNAFVTTFLDIYQNSFADSAFAEADAVQPTASAGSMTWRYSAAMSITSSAACCLDFEMDYTHIQASCEGGRLWNLEDMEGGQPTGSQLEFAAGQPLCWSPFSGQGGQTAGQATVEFTVYNGEETVGSGRLEFVRTGADDTTGTASYTVTLAEAQGLYLLQRESNTGLVLTTDSGTASLTEETAAACVQQTLDSLVLHSDGSVSFTLPETIPQGASSTRLVLSLTAFYSDAPGSFNTQDLLDWAEDWQPGQQYTGRLEGEGELTDITFWAAFATEVEPNVNELYYSQSRELSAPFTYDQPTAYTQTDVTVDRQGQNTRLLYTLDGGKQMALSLELGEQYILSPLNSWQVNILQQGQPVGSISLYNAGASDKATLETVDTAENKLPMQIFATVALSNHEGYEDYNVCRAWDTGAVSTARYFQQDLENAEAAASAPYQYEDCVLGYDWNVAPCFVEIRLADGLFTADQLQQLAESLSFSAF